MDEIELRLYKIVVYSSQFKYIECRYGTNEDEVVRSLREEYKRYEDKREHFEMYAEEIKYNRVKVNVNLNFRE